MKNSIKALFTGKLPLNQENIPVWSVGEWTHTYRSDLTLSYKIVGTCVVFVKRAPYTLKCRTHKWYTTSILGMQVKGIKSAFNLKQHSAYPRRNDEEATW